MLERKEEVAFTGSRRQWSVPVSVAVGVMMLIGFWPAPSQISLVDASQSALAAPISSVSSTIAIEPTSQMLSASSPGGTTDAPSPRSFEVPAQDVPPLRVELLVLGESPVGGADVKVIEDVERPNNESGRFGGNDQTELPSDGAGGNSSTEVKEPNGSDVLQVIRWAGGATAVSSPADAETTAKVSQVLRLAWSAQRQAVSEGAGSYIWVSAFEYRSGFARVLGEQLRASMSPRSDAAIVDAEFFVTGVRIDTAGRAVASFCVVEDAGYASFSDTQGQWGTVMASAGSVGLIWSSGGWLVDDVARIGVVEAC